MPEMDLMLDVYEIQPVVSAFGLCGLFLSVD